MVSWDIIFWKTLGTLGGSFFHGLVQTTSSKCSIWNGFETGFEWLCFAFDFVWIAKSNSTIIFTFSLFRKNHEFVVILASSLIVQQIRQKSFESNGREKYNVSGLHLPIQVDSVGGGGNSTWYSLLRLWICLTNNEGKSHFWKLFQFFSILKIVNTEYSDSEIVSLSCLQKSPFSHEIH